VNQTSRQPDSAAPASLAVPDSARTILESLERDRGSHLLPEAEFQSARQLVLTELAEGPRPARSTLLTFGAVGVLLATCFAIGLFMLTNPNWIDPWLALAAGGGLIAWGYLLRSYLVSMREQAQMSLQERLHELEELRAHQLLTQDEYEHIYAALHISRGVPPSSPTSC